MTNSDEPILHISRLSTGAYFIYFLSGSTYWHPVYWKNQLFFGHKESYYGSFLEPVFHEKKLGFEVDSYQLLTLFGKAEFSPFYQWEWDETVDILLALSPLLLDSIEAGEWAPEFMNDEKKFRFRLPDDVREEFSPSFWKQTLFGETVEDFTKDFFHQALTEYLKQNSRTKIGQKLEQLTNSPLTAEELNQYFADGYWLQWLKEENSLPFTIGLRLSEPDEDGEDWLLDTFIRDTEKMDHIDLLSNQKQMPKKWKPYLSQINQEQKRWLQLFPWLANENGQLKQKLSEFEAWEFLADVSEKLIALGVEILLPSWWEALREDRFTVKARVRQTGNRTPSFLGLNAVLDFQWRLSMNNIDLSEEEFQKLVSEKRRLVKIRGQWVKLDPAMIQHIQMLMKQAKEEGLRVQDIMLYANEEDRETLLEEESDSRVFRQIKIELNQSLKQMLHQLHTLEGIPNIPVPNQLLGELRPYQQQGLNWLVFLRQFGFGACLADDMGLGKTIQLISYLLYVKEQGIAEMPALIFCPTSVLGNWQRELEKFAPSLKVYVHYGHKREKGESFTEKLTEVDVVLTTYGLSHLDIEELSSVRWSTIALDEAQNIKNAGTKQSRAIRKLNGEHHIALTGTPMENRLAELWSIFDFINKGYLGSFQAFQKKYIIPIEKNRSDEKIQELQKLIKPFLLRRTKRDPEIELNLPDKLEQKAYCSLTEEQAALYEQIIQDAFEKLESLSPFARKGLILKMINQLKQLCNHPALYLKEETPRDIVNRSNKLATLVDIADQMLEQQEAGIIFTQYIQMGKMIGDILKERYSIDVPFLHGGLTKAQRDDLVLRFQQGEFPFFILSLKAGGTGLNLTAANHVIHYDRWWNPAVENQATDRAYRIGQSRFVLVHKFITLGTLEERIDEMLEKKQALNDEIIQSDQWITELSNEELYSLLAITH